MQRACFLAATAVLALVGGASVRLPAQEPPPETPAGDATHGGKLYMENGCNACHGSVGQGGSAGPVLAATKLPYFLYQRQLRTPSGSMPAYGPKLLNDQELADIYAYLKSLPGPPERLPAALKD